LVALLAVIAWWLGIWDLRRQGAWPTIAVAFFFCAASGLYLLVRITCPHIPHEGQVDLRAFHRREGPKYMIGFGAFSLFTIGTNTYFGLTGGGLSSAGSWLAPNAAVIPMSIAAFVAGALPGRRVQIAALATELAMWAWYFISLQGALAG
jgi:hypothetical protein